MLDIDQLHFKPGFTGIFKILVFLSVLLGCFRMIQKLIESNIGARKLLSIIELNYKITIKWYYY
jgi:hypothetical protein